VSSPHLLTVTYDEAGVAGYRVDCPRLTDECHTYAECIEDPCDRDELDRQADAGVDNPELHGAVHHRIDGDWMRQLGQCFIATHPDLVNAARQLDVPHDGGEVAAGEYRVTVDTTDNPVDLVLELDGVDTRPNSACRNCEGIDPASCPSCTTSASDPDGGS